MKRYLAMFVLTVSIAGLAACDSSPQASSRPTAAPNAVTEWASIIQPAIHRSRPQLTERPAVARPHRSSPISTNATAPT